MYVCKYACIQVSIYDCMYVCMQVYMYACKIVCLCVCMRARMHVCMHASIHVCMYICMYVCMMYACMHVCINRYKFKPIFGQVVEESEDVSHHDKYRPWPSHKTIKHFFLVTDAAAKIS